MTSKRHVRFDAYSSRKIYVSTLSKKKKYVTLLRVQRKATLRLYRRVVKKKVRIISTWYHILSDASELIKLSVHHFIIAANMYSNVEFFGVLQKNDLDIWNKTNGIIDHMSEWAPILSFWFFINSASFSRFAFLLLFFCFVFVLLMPFQTNRALKATVFHKITRKLISYMFFFNA